MASVLLARIDMTQLYPPFLARLVRLLGEAQAFGRNYWAVSGTRTYAEQARLYFQGRTAAGPRVTDAKPGESAHNFGLAVDVCLDGVIERKGLQPDWRPASYDALRPLTAKHGLGWGGNWRKPDRPHIYWEPFDTGESLQEVREAYEAGGLAGAWKFLDAKQLEAAHGNAAQQ